MTCSAVSGQSYYYKQYNYLNGLPTMGIYNVLCANDGYVWIGSEIGLIQFDGTSFNVFDTEDGLPDTEVTSLVEDGYNRIWCITFNKKVFYVKDNVVYNDKNSKLVAAINENYHPGYFNVGLKKEVFFYSFKGLIAVLDEEIVEYKFPFEEGYHLVPPVFCWNKQMYQITLNNNKRYLFKIENGEVKNSSDNVPIPFPSWTIYSRSGNYTINEKGIISDQGNILVPENFVPNRDRFHSIFVDKNNGIWYLNQSKGVQYFANNTTLKLFENSKVNSIDQDFEGNYWISTMADGLFMLPYNFFNKQILTTTSTGIVTPINVVYVDALQWLGNTFETTYILKENKNPVTIHVGDAGMYSRVIDYEPVGDVMIVASDNNLVAINRNPPHQIKITFEYGSAKSLSGYGNDHFAVALSNGIVLFSKENNSWKSKMIKHERGFCVQYDDDGVLWFSTISGIHRFEKDSVYDISIPELKDKRIIDFEFYKPGNLIIVSTDGYGVYAINQANQIVWHTDSKSGLSSDICRQMQFVGDTLWINTPRGLNCLQISTESFRFIRSLTEADGLPSNDVKSFFIVDDELFVAGQFGVLKWRKFLDKTNIVAPKFILNQIKTDRGEFTGSNEIVTTFKDGFLILDYTIISNIIHSTKLEFSIDNGKWQTAFSNRLDLSGLDMGSHILKIRYPVNSDYFYPTSPMIINVIAPFYLQKWFIPLVVVLISVLFSSFIIYRINVLRKKAMARLKLNEDLAFAEQQGLQSMMNPHFIFNAINSVQQYIIENDKKEANRYLTQFARLIRLNLETSKNKYITLEEEIERLNLYLQFEKVRFGDKLNYSINVPSDLAIDNIKIPSMIIQPFVENAIWHGIIPKQTIGVVQIDILVENAKLVISVIDDGVGFKTAVKPQDNSKKSSLGLDITQRRLKLLSAQSGKHHMISITEAYPEADVFKGTTVKIILPYEVFTV